MIMSDASTDDDIDDVPDEVIIKVTDYVEGKLTGADQAEVAAKIASDKPEDRMWRQTHDEMADARKVISGMRKAKAPDTFNEDVTSTIEKRSAGRFFARRTLGDRVPFGVLLIVAMIALGVVGYLMWSSPTGSLEVQKRPAVPNHKPLGIERP
jgi:anti-sigma factor RsiW